MTLKELYKIDRKLFQLAVAYSVLDGRSFDFDTTLLNTFAWSATKEGREYWYSVYTGETTIHTREYKPPYYTDITGKIVIRENEIRGLTQITSPLQIQNYLEKRFPEIKEFTSKDCVEDIPLPDFRDKPKLDYNNMTLYELHNTNLVLFQLVVMELILQEMPLILGNSIRRSFDFSSSIQGKEFWYDIVERSTIGAPIHVIPYLKTKKKLIKPVNSSVIGMITRYLEKQCNCPSGALIRKHGSSSTKWHLKKEETTYPPIHEVPERPIDANITRQRDIETRVFCDMPSDGITAAGSADVMTRDNSIGIGKSQSKPTEVEPLVIKKKTTKYLKI